MKPSEAMEAAIRDIFAYKNGAIDRAVYGATGAATALERIGLISKEESADWRRLAKIAGDVQRDRIARGANKPEPTTEEILTGVQACQSVKGVSRMKVGFATRSYDVREAFRRAVARYKDEHRNARALNIHLVDVCYVHAIDKKNRCFSWEFDVIEMPLKGEEDP